MKQHLKAIFYATATVAFFITWMGCSSDAPAPHTETSETNVQVVEIKATALGYRPAHVELKAGLPARLIFTRTVDSSCLEAVRIPDFGIEKTTLPLNEPTVIEFTPDEAGTFTFVCGMGMQSGTIMVAS